MKKIHDAKPATRTVKEPTAINVHPKPFPQSICTKRCYSGVGIPNNKRQQPSFPGNSRETNKIGRMMIKFTEDGEEGKLQQIRKLMSTNQQVRNNGYSCIKSN
jgi:hypothetical protein